MKTPALSKVPLIDLRRTRTSGLILTLAGAAMVAGSIGAADARYVQRASNAGRSGYDGYWNVIIVTDVGACARTYSFPVQIAGGRVLSAGGAQVSGAVGRGGAVVVQVSSGGSFANGSGRLGAGLGRGHWSGRGSAGFCSGRWQATR